MEDSVRRCITVEEGTECASVKCNYVFKNGDYALNDISENRPGDRCFHHSICRYKQSVREGKGAWGIKITPVYIRVEESPEEII